MFDVKFATVRKMSAQFFLIVSMVFCFCHYSDAFGEVDNQSSSLEHLVPNTFYLAPNFRLYQTLISQITDFQSNGHYEPSLKVFSVMVMAKHPRYAEQFIKNFSELSKGSQRYLLSVLLTTGHDKIANELQNDFRVKPMLSHFVSPREVEAIEIKNETDLDCLWAAYFATGDMFFVKKMVKFITHDDFEMMVGYEALNRAWMCDMMKQSGKSTKEHCPDLSDWVMATTERYPHSFHYVFQQSLCVSSAIWSMDSNIKQDKQLKSRLYALVDSHPNLNYWKKINRMIK